MSARRRSPFLEATLIGLLLAVGLPSAAIAQGSLENGEFMRQVVNAQVRETSDDPIADYDAKIAAVEGLSPHNEQQYRLQQLTLMSLNWYRANEICVALYKSAESIADVARWLACVTPVNAGILVLAGEIRDQQIEMVASAQPGDAGYAPPQGRFQSGLDIANGDDYAKVVETIQTVDEGLESVTDVREGLQALADGGGPRQLVANMLAADGSEVQIAVGEVELGVSEAGFSLQADGQAIADGLVGLAESSGQPLDQVELEITITQPVGDGAVELSASEMLQIPLGPGSPE